MDTLATIATIAVGFWVLYHASIEKRIVIMQGKKQEIIKQNAELFVRLLFLGNIARHRVCHGKIDGKSFTAFVLTLWLFLNFPYLLFYADSKYSVNIWKFDRYRAYPNYYLDANQKVPGIFSIMWNSKNSFATVGFYTVYTLLALANLNKLSELLFPHSEKAKLVEKVVLAEEALPDSYRTITQINRNQVRVDYTGSPIDVTAFLTHKRVLSEGCGAEIEVQPDRDFGRVIITFKSKQRYNTSDWRTEQNSLVKGQKLSFVYLMPNGETLKDGRRVLKAGETTDPDRTLVAYGRGIRNPYYILVLPQVDGLTEPKLFATLGDYRLPRKPGKEGGEFFVEDDGLYDELDKIINNLPDGIKGSGKCRFAPEILERIQI